MDVKEHKSFTTSSAGIFDGAHHVRIGRAKFTNVAGNSTVNSFSNTAIIFVPQESSGVGIRSVIILLILTFLCLFLLLPFLL